MFSNQDRDEGEGSAQAIHPLPLVPHEITPFRGQATHPDPRARPLSVVGTSIAPKNGLDWIVPGEEFEGEQSVLKSCLDAVQALDRQRVKDLSGNASILPSKLP